MRGADSQGMDTPAPAPHHRLRTMAAAALGGLAATAIDVGLLSTLLHRGVGVARAAFAGALAGAIVSFLASKYVAFGDRRRPDVKQLGAFAGVALSTAALMAVAMYLACDRAHLPYLAAKLGCAALIFVCWSYPAQRRVFAAA